MDTWTFDGTGRSLLSAQGGIVLLFASGSILALALLTQYILRPAVLSALSKIPAAHWTAHFSASWMSRRRKLGCESRSIFAAHRRHGPVVRLGPDEVSVMSLEGVRKIYGGGFERTRWFDEFMNYGAPNLVTLYGREEHARRRRMVSNVFSKSFIQRSHDFHVLGAVILWERLLPVLVDAARNGQGVDFYKLGFALGAEFMSAYEFGIQNGYDLVSRGREERRDAYLLEGQRKLRGTEGPVQAKLSAEELEAQCMTMIEMTREDMQSQFPEDGDAQGEHQRRTGPVSFANLSDNIFEKEDKLSLGDARKHIASEMLDNIEAAREGIGLMLTYVTHELSLHPKTQESLRKELRDAFVYSPTVAVHQFDADSLRTLDSLSLLDAVVNETFRLRPPAPGPQRRWVPKGGVEINGFYIPAGVTVHVAPYCIHREPTVFPDAESWRPDRWLKTDDSLDEQKNSKEVQRPDSPRQHIFAFSSGGRTCLGNHFATIGE